MAKFILSTVADFYDAKDKERLELYGFQFKDAQPCVGGKAFRKVQDSTIEINTLEELLKLRHRFGSQLIVGEDEIQIFDDHL